MSIFWNGSAINSLMWNGIQTTGVYNGNIVWGNNSQQAKTLTLYHSEGGSLTADTLTGYPGDSVNLTTAYNTYWRFSGYDVTGDGTLNGNTYTFGNDDATICACYKVNAFTASGGWEKGSNVDCVASRKTPNPTESLIRYATTAYRTSNVPSDWYSTSNRWKVTSTVSAYSITLNPIMKFQLKAGRASKAFASAFISTNIGGSYTNTDYVRSTSYDTTTTGTYSKTITTSTTGVNYGISALLKAYYSNGYGSTSTYVATGTTGTWVATGYAP